MKFILPLYIELWKIKKKKILVWLNWYRNAHYFEVNKVKKIYHQIVKEKAGNIKIEERIYLIYKVYIKNKRTDYHNIRSIIEKFFLDWLVENLNIKDDSFDYVGGDECEVFIDKENPRIEIEIFT